MERVILAAKAVSGDRAKAIEWLNQPLKEFGGKTPLELIAEGRTNDVIGYLESIESGFVG
ncbi:MbcA/ParS/Xre antitoxin family protein [Dyella sp. C9]|uniref:MbcA/ParS/Xre antitoxin family protein n=1 Tax=Dyella sp. C9 TaxID=2202154 RepID=UPI001300A632|nr:MbcA/ParS/Xre antitoxin family protein [Dyella sp. C9]